MAFYVDTSALARWVVAECETTALRSWMAGVWRELVTGDLVRTELMRAVRRIVPNRVMLAQRVPEILTLIEVTTSPFAPAGRLDPPELNSQDALHLAVALDLGHDRDGLVTYDDRLSQAVSSNGVAVVAPQ